MAEVGEALQSAAAKISAIRCPKCGKLLSELSAFCNYRCESCNATLQAKRPLAFSNVNKSISQDRAANREGIPSNTSPGTNKENNLFDLSKDGKLLVDRHRAVVCNGSPASGTGSKESGKVAKATSLEKHEDLMFDTHCRNIVPVDQCSSSNLAFQGSGSDLGVACRRKDVQIKNGARIGGFPGSFSHGAETQECKSGLRKMQKGSSQGLRFSPYPAEVPPAFQNGSICAHHAYHNPDLPDTVERLEKSREELLRKLDELRDQLSRSCELKESGKERVPVVNNMTLMNHPGYRDCSDGFYEGASSTTWPSFHHFPSIDGHDIDVHNNPYQTVYDRNRLLANGETLGSYSQVCGQDPYQAPHESQHVFSHGHRDIFNVNSHSHHTFHCQPSCMCSQCFRNNCHTISQHPQSVSIDKRPYTNLHSFYPIAYSELSGTNCCSRMASSLFLPSQPNVHHRSTLNVKSEQRCRPVAGAAPFIVCDNCLQLLLLSHDLSLKNQQKLRCASCCHVISLDISAKQLRVASSLPKGPNKNTYEAIGDDQHPMDPKRTPDIFSHTDHSAVECSSKTADEKLLCSSHPLNHSEEIKDKKVQSLSPGAPNDEYDDLVIYHSDLPNSSDTPLRHEQYMPLHEHLRHSSSSGTSLNGTELDLVATENEGAIICNNLGGQIDSLLSNNAKHCSCAEATLPTEFNLPDNEHPHPEYCEDLLEGDKEECYLRRDQGHECAIPGLIKRNLKDMHWSGQSLEKSKRKVSINGHLIPDRWVKKAEKQAGRIYPGDYWYDYKAGFWGVMGQPCIGIIPPFIEEFCFPMPSNCAGGNTNVLVNGRELHIKDLELLIGRGLPSSGGRSYIIEISGRVWDAVSGEELDSLGKLAPTIEKMRRGFGMRVLSID